MAPQAGLITKKSTIVASLSFMLSAILAVGHARKNRATA